MRGAGERGTAAGAAAARACEQLDRVEQKAGLEQAHPLGLRQQGPCQLTAAAGTLP